MSLDSTKADDIALVIEEAIVSGELAPGTVLRQEQLSAQFARINHEYRAATTYSHPNFYKGLTGTLALPLLDAQWPHGMGPGQAGPRS